jgi:hypothetical protein
MMLARVAIPQESTQRYWRRRANRRVRKARLTRSLVRLVGAGLVPLTLVALLVVAGWRIAHGLTTTRALGLEWIEVEGTVRVPPAMLEAQLAPYLDRNLLGLDLAEVEQAAERHPWVRAASAKRILPHTLRLTVSERAPCAIAVIAGIAHVLDESGFVLGPSGPGFPDDLPVLVGLEGLPDEALVAALRRGAHAVSGLGRDAAPWLAEISELDLSHPDRITVHPVHDRAPILLDPERVTRNLSAWLALRHDVARRLGPLAYVDLRWNDRITVMPELPLPREGRDS